MKMVAAFLDASRRVAWVSPLLLRVVVGVAFVLTGWGKLQNLDAVVAFFDSLGIPAPEIQAPFVAIVELVGGALLVAGLATRVAAVLLTGVMGVAILTAVLPNADGVGAVVGSIEAIYLAVLVHLAVHGAGKVSIDRMLVKE